MSKASANMLKAKTPKRKKKRKGDAKIPVSLRGLAIFLLTLLIATVGIAGYAQNTETDTIVKGVRIADIDVGGLEPTAAEAMLAERVESYTVKYADSLTEMSFPPATGSENAPSVADFKIAEAVEEAFVFGHATDPFSTLTQRISARLFTKEIPLPFALDEEALSSVLTERFGRTLEPARNASLTIAIASDGTTDVTIEEEHGGATLDLPALITATRENLARLSLATVTVRIRTDHPEITASDIEPLLEDIPGVLERAPLTLTAGDDEWIVTGERIASWLGPVRGPDGKIRLGLDGEVVGDYLASRAEIINVPPSDAVFEMEDDKITTFIPSIDGERLDIDDARRLLQSALLGQFGLDDDPSIVDLPVVVAVPEVTTAQANPWGIGDILGVGESNFRGSPSNRRVNIAVGAGLLNGIVVPPGEELSLVNTLKPFDNTNGYLQELVIKGNETKPEYGGGLCQIGTTTFRAVLDAGLPVTARRNHSYRVPYYERDGDGNYMGPGIDATIYDPAPDFRFLNDTGYHVIMTTEIIGYSKLRFTIWGKDDGRTVERSEVSVWNVKPPPEKKIVKTTSLPPGKERCTESPHSGATTSFTYMVTYPDGEVKEEDFVSYYKPWGEVCLLGVTEEELAADEAGLTDTDQLPSADAAGASGE